MWTVSFRDPLRFIRSFLIGLNNNGHHTGIQFLSLISALAKRDRLNDSIRLIIALFKNTKYFLFTFSKLHFFLFCFLRKCNIYLSIWDGGIQKEMFRSTVPLECASPSRLNISLSMSHTQTRAREREKGKTHLSYRLAARR